ncbi:alpha-glucuronidase [Kibdelosporangium banguiense]|uniref:Xylan alpha-1,2-glucuronidase n=1 Tax=Kibdelosporangium banguiense TaxID=1365924 RepID=A0ABS4TR53_9PSEU|nr:alpha-glucuronidase family glycosyl hydrolase [Kibdelosporangium banguiense]MBP2326890.1 alpha-glucuronidase [Kibdelosporangium banguiense]
MRVRSGALFVACIVLAGLLTTVQPAVAAQSDSSYDGSSMWLRYVPVGDPGLLAEYRRSISTIVVENSDREKVHRHTPNLSMAPGSAENLMESTLAAARNELTRGLGGLLDKAVPVETSPRDGAVIVGTRDSSPIVSRYISARDLASIGKDGYLIRSVSQGTVIAGNTDIGALYGTFAFLRLLQTHKPITGLAIAETPKIKRRHLNYWETERLYAGNNPAGTGGLNGENGAIFNFAATGASAGKNLPVILDRYIVAARAMASVGINGITINNVNANAAYLTPAYIEQEAALADALRPYGIKLAVSINYASPTDARFAPDTLTNQQLNPYGAAFQSWWNRRARQLQAAIPDFIGFTVKANSEGQPGPQDFGYDHGDGANGVAAAVAPLGMTIFWRTFVYNANVDNDRLKRPYLEFGHIDDELQPDGTRGRFAGNVFLQTKNGPLDFQAREPIHPMFGRMENTNQAIELQVTQEYTGQSTMLSYLAPMWEEVLKTDTHGAGLVGNVVDGTTHGQSDTAIVGVANLGNADNLTGHHFSQANLFAFGRQAWNWTLDAEDIADDWVRMTWSNNRQPVHTIVKMMMGSREALVNYQTPLGVAHQFRSSDHYGPNPAQWFIKDDWSPVYYNKADSAGLGYDRSATGSNFVAQYFPALATKYGNIDTVPENLMMWFHHVPWNHRMRSGRIFWDELVYRYQMGVQYVTWMRQTWDTLRPFIDTRRFSEVAAKLSAQETDAADWRDTSVNYWKEFSGRQIPVDNGPLSIRIVVDGRTISGFDLSAQSYTIPVRAGASPAITKVIPADPRVRHEILSQDSSRAVIRVTGTSYFGPIVKDYVFTKVRDTTLKAIRINGRQLSSFSPDTLAYHVLLPDAKVTATANDAVAAVRVDQSPGQAKVTVTNGDATSTYTVDFDTPIRGSDEFNAAELGPQWRWVRPDSSKWRLSNGSLVITSQTGDLQESANTARNVALQPVNGDWTADSRLVFSRPVTSNNEQGGIIAYADDDNYVKLAWEMSNATAPIDKRRVALIREQNGVTTTSQITGSDAQRIVGTSGALWLRLTKAENTYKAYYSSDGTTYKFLGATTLTAQPTDAGLIAFNRAGTTTDLDVAFDHFRIKSQGERIHHKPLQPLDNPQEHPGRSLITVCTDKRDNSAKPV